MTYRIYYNRMSDFPQVWSIDEGTSSTEINVVGFELLGVSAKGAARAPHPQVERQPFGTPALSGPTAWVEVDGLMTLECGVAVFRPLRERMDLADLHDGLGLS